MRSDWEVVIGLETHAQLTTVSKIFSGASTKFGAEPNTQASAVDIALPGTLPVLNKGAVERAIRFGLAVGGKIAERCVFARKNYFYPDLPKGYQISQYEQPVVVGGTLSFLVGDVEKTVNLTRAHLEEDAGKLLHESVPGSSAVDLNRAGTPLLEIVTEPDMRSAAEAVAYAKTLHALVRWIRICDGNMQEGSFRCDANVSVRRKGEAKLGTRCEIKNLNSFRFLERAIEFEIRRQIDLIEDGGVVVQETRLYDADRDETRSMRSKEDAQDYRYFPDPDLLPLEIRAPWIEATRDDMGELPRDRFERYIACGLSAADATRLNANFDIGNYFDGVVRQSLRNGESEAQADFKLCANWVINDVAARMNAEEDLETWQFGVSDDTLGYMIRLYREDVISARTVKDLFAEFWAEAKAAGYVRHGGYPEKVDEIIESRKKRVNEIIESRHLRQVSDSSAIEAVVDQAMAANPKLVEDFRAGKEKAFNALVGQVMKATQGKANPAQVNEILRKKLASP